MGDTYMEKLEWSEKFSLQIQEIDDQHKKLFMMINELQEGRENGDEKEAISAVLTRMGEYLDFHFSTEEKYMQEFNYPEFTLHRSQHAEFVAKFLDFMQKVRTGEENVSNEILHFLKDWLINHVLGSDARYVSLFKEKGLK